MDEPRSSLRWGCPSVTRACAIGTFVLLSACQQSLGPPVAKLRSEALVGAHYYLWFPARFDGGNYLRARLRPGQQPQLGEYSSSSSPIVEQHIAWAAASGVDFFTLDWWPSAPQRNALIDEAVLTARNIADIRFCIFYELWDLGYNPSSGLTVFDDATVERFLSDMDEIASRYFAHPRYLRVAGRPVIILYVTRTAAGRFVEAMSRFRARMAQIGIDPFVIGDEIFWSVARVDGAGATDEPQRTRIALLDAITAYNLYDSSRPACTGYGASSRLLTDSFALYERYRQAVPGKPIIPLALPGYNDRGLRLDEDHPAIPREWAPGAGEGTFFAEWLDRFTLPLIDPRLPMMLVTSWNEWSEDTAIEPVASAPATAADQSRSGAIYTQGYRYEGYGSRYLDILREKTGR
ncbi:MAG TPA: glycoside hydrolase family 99-like domain-containing protein [Vicinamibacteria bacterium]|nr:glycoside hydrolase family 99-like domain-containing protein [Vicinamibacteria bacterium]